MNSHRKNLAGEPAASSARQGRLADKVAVITGCASGIGEQIALTFTREAAKVVIADLDPKAAQDAASEVDPLGQCALGGAMDVSNEELVEAGSAQVIEAFVADRWRRPAESTFVTDLSGRGSGLVTQEDR